MEHFNVADRLVPYVVSGFHGRPFTLLDVGCSGGIDPAWRRLEPTLRAYGFDPNIGECQRLQSIESNPLIEYVPAFVSGGTDNRLWHGRNPWNRMAVAETVRIRALRNPAPTLAELTVSNEWQRTKLADPEKAVFLPDFIDARGLNDIDFIKIDVDGPDFDILKSLEKKIDACGVIGIGMEVNFYGSSEAGEHTFHNTDRYLRSLGFDLLDLSIRRYAMAAFPSRYLLSIPAQSESGRPFQGDALYFRDLSSDFNARFSARLTAEKFWSLAAVLVLFGKLDELADLIVRNPDKFGQTGRAMLDEMVRGYGIVSGASTYSEYMARFRDDDPSFYP